MDPKMDPFLDPKWAQIHRQIIPRARARERGPKMGSFGAYIKGWAPPEMTHFRPILGVFGPPNEGDPSWGSPYPTPGGPYAKHRRRLNGSHC